MQKNQKNTFIISLGGSLIIQNGEFDIEFLKSFNKFIREKINAGMRFFITCGGGATARNYINAADNVIGEELTDQDRDWLGVHSTRLNAHLIKTMFRDLAYTYMIKHYDIVDKNVVDSPLIIGGGWKPGFSTDLCATMLAEDYNIGMVINMSNIDKVYDKDPNKYPDAKPLDNLTWQETIKIVGDKWSPGLNMPFDPIASAKAKEIGLKVAIINGKNLDNLDKVLKGKKFFGTLIK